jgi:ABC-2 type transport system ATP-binding protein
LNGLSQIIKNFINSKKFHPTSERSISNNFIFEKVFNQNGMSSMLKVSNLHKEFSNVIAVDNLSFEIKDGEIFGLLGPNGAGKTTTIRCLLNIIQPERGEISFNGKSNLDIKDMVGYIPEERGLYTKSRVIDVLMYFGQLKGKQASFVKNRINYYLNKLGMKETANRKINELSKGNQQKIQLISAFISEPKILILDEPFAGLDPINQELVIELIKEFLDEGKIIILSTHQMDIAEKLCHKILLMNKGKQVLYGYLNEIKKQFGRMNLHLKGTNLDDNLKNYPEFESVLLYENYAEIFLKDHFNTKEILQKLLMSYNITSFEIKEPSLHSIFIRSIKGS